MTPIHGTIPEPFRNPAGMIPEPLRPRARRGDKEWIRKGEVLVVEVHHHLQVRGNLRDDLVDLEIIARATRGDHDHARRVARYVLAKARTKVADPTAFVLTAVRADPARHRANAPTTHARCPEHDLDLPCQACAADRKAGRP